MKIKSTPTSEAVEPGSEGIRNGTYLPLSRPLFLYVNKTSAGRPEVERFVLFFLDNAATFAGRKKVVALPAEAYAVVRKRFVERKTGSTFGGTPRIGLSIDELLRQELK